MYSEIEIDIFSNLAEIVIPQVKVPFDQIGSIFRIGGNLVRREDYIVYNNEKAHFNDLFISGMSKHILPLVNATSSPNRIKWNAVDISFDNYGGFEAKYFWDEEWNKEWEEAQEQAAEEEAEELRQALEDEQIRKAAENEDLA